MAEPSPLAASAPPPGAGPERLYLEVPARAEWVGACRALVAAAAARLPFTLPELDEVRVMVSEAVSNAVLHAYPEGSGQGTVRLWVDLGGGRLELWVRDEGQGMADPDGALRAGYTTREGRLGMGFAFLQSLSDHLEVVSAPGAGTTVHLVKHPAAGREGQGPG